MCIRDSTRGVTGFVGSGTDPIPLTEEEIRKMGFEVKEVNVDYSVNDSDSAASAHSQPGADPDTCPCLP